MAQDLPDIPLVVRYPLLNRETSLLKDWSIESAYLTSTDHFDFTLFDPVLENMRELELQPVELLLNSTQQLVGRIARTRSGHDGLAVTCSGLDFMADIVECNVDPTLKIKLGDTLIKAVMLAASPVGITTVLSDEDILMHTVRSGRKPPKGRTAKKRRKKSHHAIKLNDFKPEPGQGIYDFLNKIIAREGATIQPGPDRNTIVIAEPTYEQDPLYAIARTIEVPTGMHNNVQTAEATRDFSKFPTYAMIHGQQARGGQRSANVQKAFDMWAISAAFRSELGRIMTETTVSGRWLPGKAAAEVKTGWLYRLLVHREEVARDAEQVEHALKRAIAERMKDTLEYRATLKGHVDPESGAVYSVDTMIQVDDDINNVHEPLWIAERTLKFDSGGATTDIVCWRPESFQIGDNFDDSVAKSKNAKPTQKVTDQRAAEARDQDQGLSKIRGAQDQGFSKIQR